MVPVVAAVPFGTVEDEPGLEWYFGDNCRRVVEYSGYTWDHLPVPKIAVAIRAIFAARIAFSSLLMRSRLK